MFLLVAAFITANQPAPHSRIGLTASIFSTVGHSEFCPPGNVTVDLRTGRYAVTPRAARRTCDDVGLERPVRKGALSSKTLAAVRAAYLRVLSEGLGDSLCLCRVGDGPRDIIVNNGGTPTLLLTTGRSSNSAPDDLNCWSAAATALHDILDEAFRSFHQR